APVATARRGPTVRRVRNSLGVIPSFTAASTRARPGPGPLLRSAGRSAASAVREISPFLRNCCTFRPHRNAPWEWCIKSDDGRQDGDTPAAAVARDRDGRRRRGGGVPGDELRRGSGSGG